jgi:uncharacterized lipoprotein YajG
MISNPNSLRLVAMAAVLILAGCASKPKPAAEAPAPAPPPAPSMQGQVESTIVPERRRYGAFRLRQILNPKRRS